MKKYNVFVSICIAVLLIGCGASAPAKVTSLGEIVGIWKSDPPGITIKINLDETVEADISVSNINDGAQWEYDFWFEGSELKIGEYVGCFETIGTYELQKLPNGNLEFNVIEDECSLRVSAFMGQQEAPIKNVEWLLVE